MDITKVIIPAAGTGQQFLPLSKSLPREMLPLLRKPALQHIAEEAIASALTSLILISSSHKGMMSEYFDPSIVEQHLRDADVSEQLSSITRIQKASQFTTIRQPEPLGTGHAIWLARHCINKEYFGVAYPDDIIMSKQPALAQLIRISRQEKATVLAVQEVPSECVSSYGIIGIRKTITPSLFQVGSVIEKPSIKDAPSSLAIVGRYILSSKIIGIIDSMMAYDQQDISLTSAIGQLLHNNERVFAYKVQGTRYDIGTQLGWVKAVIGTSLHDDELSSSLRSYLAQNETPESYLHHTPKMVQETL
jgi:UTP--glucose-1-phosphate uridylyltransferase